VNQGIALVLDYANFVGQAWSSEFCILKKGPYGRTKQVNEIFDVKDLLRYLNSRYDIKSIDVVVSGSFWETITRVQKNMLVNGVGKQNIYFSTRPRKSKNAPDPVDKKLLNIARKRLRGTGKDSADTVVIATSDGGFAEIVPYATSRGKCIHFVAYTKPSYKLYGVADVTILRDLITLKYAI